MQPNQEDLPPLIIDLHEMSEELLLSMEKIALAPSVPFTLTKALPANIELLATIPDVRDRFLAEVAQDIRRSVAAHSRGRASRINPYLFDPMVYGVEVKELSLRHAAELLEGSVPRVQDAVDFIAQLSMMFLYGICSIVDLPND